MRWQGRQGSDNVEDRRGGGGGFPGGKTGAGIGIGGIIIAIIVALMGGDPQQVLDQMQDSGGNEQPAQQPQSAQDDQLAQFVSVVLKDNEDVWDKVFREQLGANYRKPVLVLYSSRVQTACGNASSATGPFYCPGDEKLYIDLSFYQELRDRFGAPGDFAMAYVIAHEVGHHVQKLLGVTDQVDSKRGRVSEAQYNNLSVRLELQADFYAGVWTYHAQKMKNILEEGDVEEALRCAQAIGDDNLQRQAQGYIRPETFTHGTSAQRATWLKKGMQTGDMRQGDTFAARQL